MVSATSPMLCTQLCSRASQPELPNLVSHTTESENYFIPPFLRPQHSGPTGLHNKVHLYACTRQIIHPRQFWKECTICTMLPFRNGWPCNTFSSTEAFWNKLLKFRYLRQKRTLWTMTCNDLQIHLNILVLLPVQIFTKQQIWAKGD